MADKATLDRLKAQNQRILKHDKDTLIARQKWGEITFEDARPDFDRIYWLANQITTFPIEVLPDQTVNQFVSQIEAVANHLDQIDQFNIQSGNPAGTRNSLASQLHSHTDNLYVHCAPWIPFLAHQKGDVARNIENLTKSVRDADQIVADAKTSIAARTRKSRRSSKPLAKPPQARARPFSRKTSRTSPTPRKRRLALGSSSPRLRPW